MPRIEAVQMVDVDVWTAFAVSQTTGDARLRWDPFIKRQHHLDDAPAAGPGVRTETISKHGLRMVSEYASFHPPDRVGMRMVEGPWFFERFGGGWTFRQIDGDGDGDGDAAGGGSSRTEATWRYTFTIRPGFVAPVADRIGTWMLGRDIDERLAGFARGCQDPEVLAAAAELVERWR